MRLTIVKGLACWLDREFRKTIDYFKE